MESLTVAGPTVATTRLSGSYRLAKSQRSSTTTGIRIWSGDIAFLNEKGLNIEEPDITFEVEDDDAI